MQLPEFLTFTETDKEPINWDTFNLKECRRCKLCQTRKNVVSPKIVPNCKIMFVSESPGNTEDSFGTEPLIGQAGLLFNNSLMNVGIDRGQCSLVDTVNCHPPNNRPPEKDEIEACYDIVEKAIKDANPTIIVPLGNVAFKRICKKSGILKHNGHIMDHPNYPGKIIIPVIHPAMGLRDPKNITLLEFGLNRVMQAAGGQKMTKFSDSVIYVDTYEKFDKMMKDLWSKPIFAMDIEASSLRDYKNGHIICISFSNTPGISYVLPWIIGDSKYYEACKNAIHNQKRNPVSNIKEFCDLLGLNHPKFHWEGTDVKSRLQELLKNESVSKILHNYSYDYKFLEVSDLLICGTIYDTMIMHHAVDETRGTHGLANLTLKFTNYGEYWKKLEDLIIKGDSYAIIPMDDLIPYAGTDSDVTLQVFNKLYPMMKSEGLMSLYMGFLIPLSKTLMDVEKNGITIDEEYRQKLKKVLTDDISRIDEELNKYTEDIVMPETVVKKKKKTDELQKGVNFASVKQLKFLLYDYLRLPVLGKTAKGDPSTDVSSLEALSSLHAIPKLLIDRRKRAKILGTYVGGILDDIWADGKIHPNFLICGTETGRLSANSPNVQNWPRNPPPESDLAKLGVKVRDLCVCSDCDRYYMLEVDYSQAELRIVAEYSRDDALYGAFLHGRDPHAELGVRIYKPHEVDNMLRGLVVAKDIITKEQRQNGKTANFSLLYGKYPENFATENNLTLEEAKHIHKVYWETYKGILAWKQKTLSEAYANGGTFSTYFGRKRRSKKLLLGDDFIRGEAEREGLNFVIQAQASDYTLYSTMKVLKVAKERGYDIKVISFVHDSAVYEVDKNIIQEFMTLLREIMVNVPGVSIPMEIDIKLGYHLGSLVEWSYDKSEKMWKFCA